MVLVARAAFSQLRSDTLKSVSWITLETEGRRGINKRVTNEGGWCRGVHEVWVQLGTFVAMSFPLFISWNLSTID